MVTINFILQRHGRRYGDKAAQISLDNDDGKKKVKDAVRVLSERNIPVKHWGTNEVKVLCSVLASERLDCKGQSFILTEEDLLVHCSLSSDKYVVVSPKEYDDIVVIDDEDAMDIDIKQEVDIKQEEEACDLVTNEVDSATTRRSAPSNACNNSMKTASSSSSRSPVRRALGSHIAAPTTNTAIAATSRAERLFTVGSRHFFYSGGVEYPVEITKLTPRSGKYQFQYIDYPKKTARTTEKVNLLEATAERQLAYEARQACTAKINRDAQERKTRKIKRKKEQVAIDRQECIEYKKKKVAEKIVADKELKKEKAEATSRRKYEENQVWSKRFGERVYAKDLPVEFAHCAEPRTCLVQPEMKRTLYFAAENDTPTKIAKLFVDMSVQRILYDNRQVKEYEELLTNTKLKSNSIILLPLTSSKR